MAAKPTGKPAQQRGGGGLKHHQLTGNKRPKNGGSAGGGQEFKQNKKHKSSDLPAKRPQPAAAAPTEKPTLSKHEKKEKIRQKKSALKKNFGIIQDAVPIWEVLRRHQTPSDEKARLVDQVLHKVDGKLLELARHHTASRILQFCVMYGSDAQKRLLMDQVKADFLALSKSKHGRHLVQKLISQAKKEEVPSLVGLCKGHVIELLRHPQGADVMIDLYDVANTQGRNAMCAEFYGREFSLFDGIGAKGSSLSSLAQLLEGSDNAKRRSVLLHMTKALMPIVEKGILHPPMVHRLLKDFFDCAPSATVEDVIDTLSASGTTVLKMVHTHEGAAVGCMLLAYGSAKDRKRLIKAMKGHVTTMATNEWGYTVLCTALTVVDDTSLVSKVIIAELKSMLEDAVEDPHASRVLLQLLCPNSRRYLPPAVLEMLHPPQRTVVGTSGNMVTDIEGDEDELAGGVGEAHGFGVTGDDEEGGDGEDFLQLKAPAGKKDKGKGNGKEVSKKGKEGEKEKRGQQGRGSASRADEEGEEEEGAEQKGSLAPGGKRVLGLSKKDELLRRKEILGPAGSSSSLASALTSTCTERAGALLRAAHAADVVVEVARGGAQGLLADLSPEGVAAVHAAVVAEVSSSTQENGSGKQSQADSGGEEEEDEGPGSHGVAGPQGEHVCTHYHASRAIRRLLLAGSEPGSGGECARQLARALWQQALKGQCQRWVGTHAEKVLAALLHCGCEDVAKQAGSELARALPNHEDPVAWSERLVHTALLKDKQQGGKVATKGKGKGKLQQQQQQQQQQQLLAPKAGKRKGEVAAGTTEAGSQKAGAAAATLPENSQGETTQQQQQQQQQQQGKQQEQESPAGSPEVGKKRSRHEQVSTSGQRKAAGNHVSGSAAKSISKKKKRPSDGQNC